MVSRDKSTRPPRRRGVSFTTRGSSVLAASVAAGLGSFALGETDLLRVAIVIVIVCVLTWLCAVLLPARVTATYRPEPPEAPVGATMKIRIDTRISRPMMPGTVVCHPTVTRGLSEPAHLAVPSTRARETIGLDYQVVVSKRGAHTVGPLEATMRDPFGLTSARYLGAGTARVLGLPRVHPVHPGWLRSIGVLPWAADSMAESGLDGEPDVGVREHRPEDGMRRIHWRTSARTGRLMTRLDQPESDRTAVIAFESRASMHRTVTFENTLEIVASLGAALLRQGWDLRLIDSVGERRAPAAGWDSRSLWRFLAVCEPTEDGAEPPLPTDRSPVLLVTTDISGPHAPAVAQTVYLPLAGTKAHSVPGIEILAANRSVAELLADGPRSSAGARRARVGS